MTSGKARKALVEVLASLEHEQWMAWARTLMEKESLSRARAKRALVNEVVFDE